MRTLVIATSNIGKLAEIKLALQELPFKRQSLQDYPDLDTDPQETGTTLEENAILKAKYVALATGHLALADDSGLMVDSLNGEPGIYSKRFGPTDQARNDKLLSLLKTVPSEGRSARFVAVIAVHDPQTKQTQIVEGVVEGTITLEPTGTDGFGYDPVFYSPELGKTFAQASKEEKNEISHRGRALTQAKIILQGLSNS